MKTLPEKRKNASPVDSCYSAIQSKERKIRKSRLIEHNKMMNSLETQDDTTFVNGCGAKGRGEVVIVN